MPALAEAQKPSKSSPAGAPAPRPAGAPRSAVADSDYQIGPGDTLQVFVWKNPELSADVPVRPDGKITTPLVQDIQAQGKTPTQLAGDLRTALAAYVQEPIVTVVVKTVAAPTSASAIRVIGAAVTPKTVAYHSGLTALDVMIEVGGLTTFASGNKAQLIRNENGAYRSYPLRLADLVKSGDMAANVNLKPGDVIRIPERWF
ncbi:XrtA/PEP-CTERM system exopolysaccharide export protein [Phenylobacterium sp. LjRoot219]|uniref:XrtA/PEP-CTERM system exopolysaccharide export protein n=1 Tax=Phenylobacterium sp. LjRoot219 TaxID=3342283 RepID=UPI003F506CBA